MGQSGYLPETVKLTKIINRNKRGGSEVISPKLLCLSGRVGMWGKCLKE